MIHMVTMSRMVFAGSFDRLLPARFADVSERFHTPHWSLILYGALASIYLTIWWNFGSFATLLNTSMLVPIGFALPMVATMLFPFVKRDLYIRAFGSMKGAASLVIASLIGVVAFAFYGIAETFPLISGVFLGTSLLLLTRYLWSYS